MLEPLSNHPHPAAHATATTTARRHDRIWELDFLRGLCVILMVIDHLSFSLGIVFGEGWIANSDNLVLVSIAKFARDFFRHWTPRVYFRYLVLFCFFGLCAFSCHLSRSNTKRGLRMLLVAIGITIVTALMDLITHTQLYIILFGVIHYLAVSVLIYGWMLRHCHFKLQVAIGLLIVIAGAYLSVHPLPISGFFPAILGLNHSGFVSNDYFPLIPWFGVFILAGSVFYLLYQDGHSRFPGRGQGRFAQGVMFVGNHALLFYILHQPVFFAIVWLIDKLFA